MGKQSLLVEIIIKDDWYQTASEEEMRTALMHVQQEAIDRAFNALGEANRANRDSVFEALAETCNWPK